MTVLGIDPGPVTSHWALFDGAMASGGSFINTMYRTSVQSSHPYGDDWYGARFLHVAIEKVASYGMPVGAEVFETVFWSGRMYEWYGGCPARVSRPTRKEIVTHICGSARAKDSNVRQALIDRIGAPGLKKSPGPTFGIKGDQWQALACSVYAWDKLMEDARG